MTKPMIPHLEDNDALMIDGCVAYERKTINGAVVPEPIILANFIVPFEASYQTNDPEAIIKGVDKLHFLFIICIWIFLSTLIVWNFGRFFANLWHFLEFLQCSSDFENGAQNRPMR